MPLSLLKLVYRTLQRSWGFVTQALSQCLPRERSNQKSNNDFLWAGMNSLISWVTRATILRDPPRFITILFLPFHTDTISSSLTPHTAACSQGALTGLFSPGSGGKGSLVPKGGLSFFLHRIFSTLTPPQHTHTRACARKANCTHCATSY